MTDHGDTSILPEERPDRDVRRARDLRRLGITLVWVLVLVGAAGLFGVRSGSVSTAAEGYTLEVRYAKVTRAGLAVPWRVRVTHPGGFDKPVTLAISADYFDQFDFQAFYPTPAKETRAGRRIYYEFDPPPGEVFELALDARTAPDRNGGRHSATTVLIVDGRELASVAYRTWMVP